MVDRRAEAGARFVYVLLDVLFEFNIPALVATYMMIYTFIDARPLFTMANIYRLFLEEKCYAALTLKYRKWENLGYLKRKTEEGWNLLFRSVQCCIAYF